MSCKKVNISLVAGFIFLWVFMPRQGPFLALVFLGLTWRKWHWLTMIVAAMILLRLLVALPESSLSTVEGQVVHIHENSVLIEKNGIRWQIITDQPIILDTWIKVQGTTLQAKDSSHFYSFDFEQYQEEHRIVQTILAQHIELRRSSQSIRGKIHQKINEKNEAMRSLLLRMLLFQKTDGEWDWIVGCGFHYSWLIHWFVKLLALRLNERWCYCIEGFLILALLLILHFPMALIRLFFFYLLRKSSLDLYQKISLYTLCVYSLHPVLLRSLGFIIPIGLRLIFQRQRSSRWLFLALIQSWYFYECSWLRLLLFGFFQRAAALITLCCAFDLCFNTSLSLSIANALQVLNNLLCASAITGRGQLPLLLVIYGLYLIFYQANSKQCYQMLGWVMLLLQLGWTSWWGEFSMINVGQGDCLLIRLPFNRANILIDTGKASSYAHLDAFLKAKGIKRLDALIITHSDEDHSGNKERLLNEYRVLTLIEKPRSALVVDSLSLFFLNDQTDYGNPNDNSLIVAFSMNQINFLCMGDASSIVEQNLLERFDLDHIDVVKLGHHGSASSTSLSFLAAVRPQLALLSSGVNNRYQHPSEVVLQRLASYKIDWLDTQDQGDITITMTVFFNLLHTSNQEFAIMNKVIR